MKAAFLLTLAAPIVVTSYEPPHKPQREVDTYFRCTANLGGKGARAAIVDGPAGRPFVGVSVANCFPPSWRGGLTIGNYYFAGKLSEALIRKSPDAILPSDIDRVGQLSRPPFFDASDRADVAAENVRFTVDCMVRSSPATALSIIMSEPGAASDAASASFIGAAKACPSLQLVSELSPEATRAAIALSYYRLGTIAQNSSTGNR